MRNIKTILMVTLLLCMAIAATVGLTSCNSDTTPHVHEFTETVVTEATCTKEGVMNCVCECGYSITKEIPAKGHTEVLDAAVAATCTTSGLTAGSHCGDCGLVLQAQTGVQALGHKMGAAATCTEDQVCANGCGLVYAPATGHLVTSVATCTESADCVLCGAVIDEALGHSIVIVPGIPVGCLTDGVSDGEYCDRCHTVLAEQEIVPATNHELTGVVTDPTCEEQGYTTYSCVCGLKNFDADFVDALGHDWETAHLEGANGFYKACGNSCGLTKSVATPVADSYKAAIDNSFVSDRLNSLVLKAGQYGAWGVVLNGSKLSTEYDGGIGSLDEAGRGLAYEFYLDKAGFVDIIWTIASSHWDSATGTNIGIADMAAHMTITIDGKPVDIKGLELPDGGQWWNLMNFVVDGVALDAGVHTFECKVNVHGGLNVGYMTIKSNRDVNARQINVLSADIIEENGRVYYELKTQIFGYTMDQIEMLDGTLVYALDSYTVDENGITTLRYDVTREYKLYPHLKLDGRWYVNGFNNAGDMGIIPFEEGKTVVANGRTYTLATKYNMPVLSVAMNEGTEASATPVSADVVVENNRAYWLFTYKLVGYYPEYLRVVDKSTVFAWESYTENADGTVTYKIDITDYSAGLKYPHLQVMEVLYTGAGHTDAGDIHAPSFPDGKSVSVGKKEYKMVNKWSMPAIEVVDLSDGFVNTAYDLVEYNGKACLKLTYRCIGYDYTTAKFFDGSRVLPYTAVVEGAYVTYYIDLTNTATSTFWFHMSIEGQNWNGKDGTTSGDGNVLCPDWTGDHIGDWNWKKEVEVNGVMYKLFVAWSMLVIGH